MTSGAVADVMHEAFILCVKIGGPVLVISMLIGILISILQAATQIHEQTLTFVPKLLVIGCILVFNGNWMLQQLRDFTMFIFKLVQG